MKLKNSSTENSPRITISVANPEIYQRGVGKAIKGEGGGERDGNASEFKHVWHAGPYFRCRKVGGGDGFLPGPVNGYARLELFLLALVHSRTHNFVKIIGES